MIGFDINLSPPTLAIVHPRSPPFVAAVSLNALLCVSGPVGLGAHFFPGLTVRLFVRLGLPSGGSAILSAGAAAEAAAAAAAK